MSKAYLNSCAYEKDDYKYDCVHIFKDLGFWATVWFCYPLLQVEVCRVKGTRPQAWASKVSA